MEMVYAGPCSWGNGELLSICKSRQTFPLGMMLKPPKELPNSTVT